jgi:FkbH-like protein
VTAARTEIDAAIAAGDGPAALQRARALWALSPDSATARYLKVRAEALWSGRPLVEHRVAFLRAFTLEPVLPLLEAEAALAGCRLIPWVGGFNAYGQEILDTESELYRFAPQTVVLAVQTRDLAPELWSGFGRLTEAEARDTAAETAETLVRLITQLRGRSPANILVHGLARPARPEDGLLDASRPLRQADAIELVNAALRAHCRGNPGVVFLDYDELQARHGRLAWSDARTFAATGMPFAAQSLPHMAREWWRYLRPLALTPAKVLALDLDNTLWGGVIGEDGIKGVVLGDESPGVHFKAFQRAIADVARRGVLLAVASKNNPDDALAMIDGHPHMVLRRDAFSALRINWEPKAQNLLDMAQELNVGIDSFVFVDDNPAECEAVRRSLPGVEVIELPADPALYADLVRFHPALERLTVSAEDLERGRYYADERERRLHQNRAETLEEFLASLDIVVTVQPVTAATLARSAQLTQKTNQLNTTTRRYSEAEFAAMLTDPERRAWSLRARDRFGDTGLVGVAVCRRAAETLVVEAFLLSCRVIGRGVETAFLSVLADRARQDGFTFVEGAFIPTPKNPPAARIYADAGFQCVETDESGAEIWRLDLKTGEPETPAWVRLETVEAA